jgi:hypothetical protein
MSSSLLRPWIGEDEGSVVGSCSSGSRFVGQRGCCGVAELVPQQQEFGIDVVTSRLDEMLLMGQEVPGLKDVVTSLGCAGARKVPDFVSDEECVLPDLDPR